MFSIWFLIRVFVVLVFSKLTRFGVDQWHKTGEGFV